MNTIAFGVKRVLDVVVCLIVFMVTWPLLLLIAILVTLSSPGPVFFVQERVGMGEKLFRIYKFRTMVGKPSRRAGLEWTASDEARITPVGRFLRDYGLDELPQILNILRGEMSIVGPRPPLPMQVEAYTERQLKVFGMRPGVLSLAAVEGRRSLPVERRIELHICYVENWSLSMDLRIFLRAIWVVLRRKNATEVLTEQELTR